MFQDYVTPLPLLLVASIHAACLVATAMLFLFPTARYPDWRVARPGPMHWFAYIGSWGLSLLMTWIWLFVGSARYDAEHQMHMALLLIVGFGVGAIWSAFYIVRLRRAAVRWRGTEIRWQSKGKEICQEFTNFEEIKRGWDGAAHIRFRDGKTLKLDPYARNAVDLVDTFWQSVGETTTIAGSQRRYQRFPIAGRIHRVSNVASFAAIFVGGIVLRQVWSNPDRVTAQYPEHLTINGADWYMSLTQMRILEIAIIVFFVACFCGVTTGYYMEDVEK